MPDIFDSIPASPAAAPIKPNALQVARLKMNPPDALDRLSPDKPAAPKGDAFDRLFPDKPVSSTQGDAFDRLFPDQPNVFQKARANANRRGFPETDTLAPGLDPAEVHQWAVENQARAEADAGRVHGEYMQDVRVKIASDNAARQQAELDQQNPFRTAANAFEEGTANTIIKGVAHVANALPGGHLNDTQMSGVNRAVENATQQQFPNDPTLLSAQIGHTAADVAPIVASSGAAPIVMGLKGLESRQEDIENRRAAGQKITPEQQHRALAGGAVLDVGMGLLGPGGATSRALLGEAPLVANTLGNLALRTGVNATVGAGENVGFNMANNAMDKYYNQIDPDRKMTEGNLSAGVTGALMTGGGGLIHDLQSRGTSAHTPEVEQPVTPLAPHSDAEMEHLTQQAAAKQNEQPAAQPPADANPIRSAREQQYERLQQYARDHGQPVPELTPGLHGDVFDRLASPPTEGRAAPASAAKPADINPLAAARQAVNQKPAETPVESAPNILAAMRANRAAEKPAPDTESGDGESVFDKLKQHGADTAARLATDESGEEKYTGAFVKQDVLPATNRVVSATKQIATAIDRDMNLGFTTTPKGKETGLSLRKMQGDAEAAGHAFESQVAPYREHVPSFRENAKDALIWADQVEASGTAPNKESQPAADALLAMRKQNADRAAKLGINNLDAEGFGLSRLFKPAEGKIGKGNSLAGTNKPFFHQKYDTFSDAYTAAAKSGLVPAYDNPLDMQIARQYEVEKNLAARENIRKADNEGTIKWVPDGEKPEPQFDAKLTDPLLASETRRLAAPRWMVGKLSQMSHFEALRYLDEIKPRLVDVKPGEESPEGYAFTGKEQVGTYHAPSDTARFFNNALNHGVGDPISTLGRTVARTALGMRYLMSTSHGMAAMASNAGFHLGQAMKSLMAADATGAGQSMLDALNPLSGLKRGHELREELENPGTHPHLSDVAQRVQAINPGLKLRSVLDRSTYQNAIESFKNGNPIGGTAKMVGAALKLVGNATYNNVLPNIMAGGLRNVAEADVRAGTSEPEGRANMAQAHDTLAHLIGHHVRGNEFSAGVEKTVGRMIFPAYDLMRGQVENLAGAATGRNPHALAALAGMAAVTAISSGIAQMAYSYATTGKVIPPSDPRDFWNPRTGRTDANGHEERLTLPGMMPFLLKMVGMAGGTQGIANEVHGRLNPLISGGMETWQNKDFQGNQVRPTEGSAAGNFLKGLGHTVKGTLPIAGASQFDNPTGQPMTTDERIGKAFGVQYGHPVTSDAEQTVYEMLDRKSGGEGRTPDQEQTRQNERRWVQEIRAGHEDAAESEMEADPQMSPSRGRSVFRRAAEKQGLPGLLADDRLGAPELLTVWKKATDAEKTSIRDVLQDRLDKAKPTTDAEDAAWDKLEAAVGGK